MTWLWLTCSSALLAANVLAGTVSGTVSLTDSREPTVRQRKNYSGVVIWLEPVGQAAPPPAPQTHTMLQKGKRFNPHVLAVPVGSTVEFPNADPIFHNAFSNFAGQPFDTGLYPPGGSQKIRFQREGAVRVFCNIHAAMSGVILVLNTPWFGVTGPGGAFQIENVPPGDYQIRIWHERASEATLKALERRISVTTQPVAAPAVTISESGYLEVPHRNKFGREYGPEPPERPGYRGGVR